MIQKLIARLAMTAIAFLLLLGFGIGKAEAQITIAAPYSGVYSGFSLGQPPGVPGSYGGLAFKPGDTNTLYMVGGSEGGSGAVYSVSVIRGTNGHITGFSGTAPELATASGADGGLAIAPNGTLLYGNYSTGIGEIPSGSSTTTKVITVTGASQLEGGTFVPTGFPGAGLFKTVDYSNGDFNSIVLSPDSSGGTYSISAQTTPIVITDGGSEGFAYIASGNPGFSSNAILMNHYHLGTINLYSLDSNGNPSTATGTTFATFGGPEGMTIDPVTGDLLLTSYNQDLVYEVQGFAAPAKLTSLSPSTVTFAGPAFSLTITGSGFLPASIVKWNNTALTITSQTPTQLVASVPRSLFMTPQNVQITVVNPNVNPSNALTFTVQNRLPYLGSATPSTIPAGSASTTLALTGGYFLNGETAYWNSTPLATTYQTVTQMSAVVPSSLLTTPGTASLSVVLSGTGGGSSRLIPINVTPTAVIVSGLKVTKTANGYSVASTLKNTGSTPATSITIVGAYLGAAASTTTFPINIGTLAAGATTVITTVYPSSAGADGTVVFSTVFGSFSGGIIDDNNETPLP